MKLRNKKTGEIRQAKARENGIYLYDETTEQWYKYELDLLAKGWEYYEEPKDIWWLDNEGSVNHANGEVGDSFRKNREIGNFFKTREEAERAREKLKAWKRLKDKGFKFDYVGEYENLCGNGFEIPITAIMPPEQYNNKAVAEDLARLFFGGGK